MIRDILSYPEKHYGRPEEILRDERLSNEEKVAVLKAWKNHLKDESEATTEGMPVKANHNRVHLEEVVRTLERLEAPNL